VPILAVEEASVQFGGLQALQTVDLTVEPGCITGLIGPNGAGKTTMFNVICGLQVTTTGRVVLDGQDVTKLKAHQRARRGLGRTFQRLEVFGSLTVRENVRTSAEIRRRWSRDRSRSPAEVADELVERVGLGAVADEQVDTLSTGTARLVELARALATQPRVLLLDEPSSGLDEHESEDFAQLLLDLTREGLAILMVEHDVPMVMRVCTNIHVLDFGRLIAVGPPDDIQANQAVQEAYLGMAGGDDAA
jgi:branched-chain amino acid transport system ATP-binding protein